MGGCESLNHRSNSKPKVEVETNYARSIAIDEIQTFSKTICKININNQQLSRTGFFMFYSESLFLLTNYQEILQDFLESYSSIEIENMSGYKIELKLNSNERYIKFLKNYNVIVIQIKNTDGINKYFEPFTFEDKKGIILPNELNSGTKYIFSFHFPTITDKMKVSAGRIEKIINHEFIYTLDTDIGSFGCPIFLSSKETKINNCYSKLIGINIFNKNDKMHNYGIFIEVITEELNKDIKTGLIKKDTILPVFNDSYNNNYIIAEIFIDNTNINKDLQIISSYEENLKRFNEKKKFDMEFRNENEIKECEIKINDEKIDFSYFYTFKKKGKNIISYLFKKKLTNINYMFSGCSSLTSMDLSNFNTDDVTNMRALFFECSSLININLFNLNTLDVIDIGFMFSNCSSLNNIDLSNLNTQNVIYMENLFDGCSSLRYLNLSNFNTKKVKYMQNMFSNCSLLETIDFSSFNTQNVTNMSFMFSHCSSLRDLDLSYFDTGKVKDMSKMFIFCSSLTKLDLSYFNTQNVINMSGMFSYCSKLKYLNISNFNVQKVTNIQKMFDGCSCLKKDFIDNTIRRLMN